MSFDQPMTNAAQVTSSGFMLREIYEQPDALRRSLRAHLSEDLIFADELQAIESSLLTFKKIIIAASGSSRHAGLAGEIMIEDLSGTPVDVEYASEYCYRSTHAGSDPLVIVITQSGETADTVAAQREALTSARRPSQFATSRTRPSLAKRQLACSPMLAQELAIPATKSFTTQLSVLYMVALFLRAYARTDDLGGCTHTPATISRNFQLHWNERSLHGIGKHATAPPVITHHSRFSSWAGVLTTRSLGKRH